MVNLEKLNDAIDESGIARKKIAEKLGICRVSLFNKLKGATELTASEIYKLRDILRLSHRQLIDIFFADDRGPDSTKETS